MTFEIGAMDIGYYTKVQMALRVGPAEYEHKLLHISGYPHASEATAWVTNMAIW